MTFLQIKTEVQTRIARTTTVITTEIPIWIKETQRRIANLYNWSFMKTTFSSSTATQETPLPTDFKDLISVYIVFGASQTTRILYPIRYDTAIRYYYATLGIPLFYSLESDQKIIMFPAPYQSVAFVLNYYKFPPDLSADTDINAITTQLPELLICGSLAEGFEYLQEPDYVKIWNDKFSTLLQELISKDVEMTSEKKKKLFLPKSQAVQPGVAPQ